MGRWPFSSSRTCHKWALLRRCNPTGTECSQEFTLLRDGKATLKDLIMDAHPTQNSRATYTLKEIADWQLKAASGDVTLPDLQRGFVWKPFQTENLWDSLLRRFPVGTFVLAPSQNDTSNTFELLDGQQRATAIAFGFFDPWAADSASGNFWRVHDIPILWLDLRQPDNAEIKFAFRLLTRSQPWGYERKDNQTPLTATDRRKFLSALAPSLPPEERGKRYLELPLTRFWPWDAKLPVPFAFLLKSFPENDWKDRITSLCAHHFPILKTKHLPHGVYPKRIEEFLAGPDGETLRSKVCSVTQSTHLPVLKIPREVFEQNDPRSRSKAQSNDSEDYVPDDVETLFIRINSAGTPLAGEELVYSIYKSIFPETIHLVERAGEGLCCPPLSISRHATLCKQTFSGKGNLGTVGARRTALYCPLGLELRNFAG